ncbi:hypothetical protein LTR08_008152 [Meristemomyces frigidus]|nr:hypothetical protein LTR08_008152 [Meristemomyces frigidus]
MGPTPKRKAAALESDRDKAGGGGEGRRAVITAIDMATIAGELPIAVLAFHEGDDSYHLATVSVIDIELGECWVVYEGIDAHMPVTMDAKKIFKLPNLPSSSEKVSKPRHLQTASLVLAKDSEGSFVAAQLLRQVRKHVATYKIRYLHSNVTAIVSSQDLEVMYQTSKTAKKSANRKDQLPPLPQTMQQVQELNGVQADYADGQEKLAKWVYDGELHKAVIQRTARVDGDKVVSYVLAFIGRGGALIEEDLEVDSSDIFDLDPRSFERHNIVFARGILGEACFNPVKVLHINGHDEERRWQVQRMFGERSKHWLKIESLRIMYADSSLRLDPTGDPLFPTKDGKRFLLQNSGVQGRELPMLHPPYTSHVSHGEKDYNWRVDEDTDKPKPCAKVAWRDITSLSKTRKGSANNPVVDAQERIDAGDACINGVLDGTGEDGELLKWTASDATRNLSIRTEDIDKVYWQKKSEQQGDPTAPHGCWFWLVKKDGDNYIFAMEVGAEKTALRCARAMSRKLTAPA